MKIRVPKSIRFTKNGTEQTYYSLSESILMRFKWKFCPLLTRFHIWWSIKRGLIGKDLEPLKCH